MIEQEELNDLRRCAGDLLPKRKKKAAFNQHIYKIIEELNLYQVELEIQNENLIGSQLELQASHNKYADLYNLAPIAYFTCNSDDLIVDVNQAGLTLLGMAKHVLINRSFSRYIIPEFQALFSQYRQRIFKESTPQSCELKLLRWSGPAFDAQLESRIIQDSYTCQKQLLICITDITSRKSLEKALHFQQVKMASIDRLRSMNEQIYSVARSQNHSLAIIDNYLYGCIRRLESDNFIADELLSSLKKAAQQSKVLANIILQMKNFFSKSSFRYELVDINNTINEMLHLQNNIG